MRSETATAAQLDAVAALLDGGSLCILDGPRGKLLATLAFGAPAFGPAIGGEAVANELTADSGAVRAGRAAWFRAVSRSGETIMEGTAGTGDVDLVLDTADVRPGARVGVERLALQIED
jgi:hypothetical protein